VAALVAEVEANRFVEAIEAFYHPDATMQENQDPPRRGLAALVAGERMVLSQLRSIETRPGSSFFVDGDRAVIRWTFHFTRPDGGTFELHELAYQVWRGDRIATEQFFYDPAQRTKVTAPA
jgi:ketosteroid isomerase-like protein